MAQPTLSNIVAWIESKNDPYALRFEPKIFTRQNAARRSMIEIIRRANNCDVATAQVIYATSFGAYQIMGFNLYGSPLNYRGKIGKYLSDEVSQQNMFYDFCEEKLIDYSANDLANSPIKREHFAIMYNGSRDYAAKIVESLNFYGVNAQ